uniref:Uncharacterized protein n=1 Tax=Ananas comosus var. bracteatus TaxID=296719 RepID=A0A6V7Q3T0_ANACO|nr:unnamed protein product [Ananas comosus var. bracteatus]
MLFALEASISAFYHLYSQRRSWRRGVPLPLRPPPSPRLRLARHHPFPDHRPRPSHLGTVNLASLNSSSAVLIRSPTPFSPSPTNSNATVLGLVASLPYDVSAFAVDTLLVPYGFDLAASEIRPPVDVNITRVLVEARGFNVAASRAPAEKRGGGARGA